MPDCPYPRVTQILRSMVLFDQDASWLKPRYLRRGRLVDAAANLIATGFGIDGDWWKGHSGEAPDDRVEHEEVREYLIGVSAFLREHEFVVTDTQLEVVNESERYIGHLDWLGHFKKDPNRKVVIDLKCGPPPPQWISVALVEGGGFVRRINPLWTAYRRQTALYKMALAQQSKIIVARAGLHLFDGTYQLVPHDDPRDLSASTIMVRSYHDREQFRST
jgi:hypothetical protein